MVVASSPYMFVGPFGLAAARLVGAHFAWDVRDLTWEYIRATGRRTFGLVRPIERLMCSTARRADVLTTATYGQLAAFPSVPERAAVVTNGLSPSFLEELRMEPPGGLEARRPRVVYAGLIGYPQGLGVMLDLAERLPDVDIALVGVGPERAELETEARRRELGNVTFAGFVEGEALRDWYRSADVLVAHLRADPAFAIAQPSKLWEYMATGRPVIYGGEGEAAELIERHGIAVTVPPGSPDAMAAAVRELLDDPEHAEELGRRGRAFVQLERDRERLVAGWVGLLQRAL
jgi:glycosyltransferase involved in cell wall biosynthesis